MDAKGRGGKRGKRKRKRGGHAESRQQELAEENHRKMREGGGRQHELAERGTKTTRKGDKRESGKRQRGKRTGCRTGYRQQELAERENDRRALEDRNRQHKLAERGAKAAGE